MTERASRRGLVVWAAGLFLLSKPSLIAPNPAVSEPRRTGANPPENDRKPGDSAHPPYRLQAGGHRFDPVGSIELETLATLSQRRAFGRGLKRGGQQARALPLLLSPCVQRIRPD